MAQTTIPSCRIDLPVEIQALQADYARIRAERWQAHFNTNDYVGDWSGLALRAPHGKTDTLYPDPTATNDSYRDTALLEHCPGIRAMLSSLRCDIRSVRLLRLAPGAVIKEHRDHALSFEENEVRLHIPIVTNSEVQFVSNGASLAMNEGECWYINASLRHSAENRGTTERVHLVIDCVVNDWLRALFHRAMTLAQPQIVEQIVSFVRSIGIPVEFGAVGEDAVLPGIRIQQAGLIVDLSTLLYPGDILHEAGHIAVAPPNIRRAMDGTIDPATDLEHAGELMTLPWTYAAALHIGLDPAIVFHPDGYHGSSESLLDNFRNGRYIGVPMLEWAGMTLSRQQAATEGGLPFPHMTRWIRES
ncbi:MAG: aspartyl/asparaginyl beta-hydroxylase domain-containing protein [Bacteroidetes bacterium]|nr:aspartyl/asparaginyl beta-hydroxylase domain-containing protein [Bacteroidota bacterium]